jgi:hypothetical protein
MDGSSPVRSQPLHRLLAIIVVVSSSPALSQPPSAVHRLQLAPTGEAERDEFGIVSSAGDVNGDGFDDVIVGARFNDAGGINAGRAYLYFGGPATDEVADLVLTGEALTDEFGRGSSAGDVNGDGFDDVIVGAHFNDAGGSDAGRAYLYYGGAEMDSVADLVITGATAGAQLGVSVSGAGDVNRDGFADVIIGASRDAAGGTNAGRAYLFHGGRSMDAVADLVLTGEAAGDNFGISVSSAGDVDGDGFADLIVGANANDAAGMNAGRAYVYLGGRGADAVPDVILTGEAALDDFGRSVSSAGDVNGDGLADVIVGAINHDAGGANAGRAYVYFGGSAPDAVPDLTLTGEAVSDWFGIAVSSAGDVNRDGFGDVIVGSTHDAAGTRGRARGGTATGRAYVYFGGSAADAVADFVFTGEPNDLLGTSVSGAGDVNGDGFGDLILGATFNDAGGSNAGRAYVYDCNRYFVTSPAGGVTWNVGATETISWRGAEPADVWLSVDGGGSYSLLRSGVGDAETNSLAIVVPNRPTRYARVKVTPENPSIGGSAVSDSLYTIRGSVRLLFFWTKPAPGEGSGALLTWSTDPGPEVLSRYRLEKTTGRDWTTVVETEATSYHDSRAEAGTLYRLTAINGLNEEYALGEALFGPEGSLAAWPLPYRGGELRISFLEGGHLAGSADLSLHDVTGRRVRTLVRNDFEPGYRVAIWDGRDELGRQVSSGIYFLRLRTSETERTLRLVVVR